MKKLTLVTLISSVLSAGAFAGNSDKEKIDSTFAEIDADGNGYVTQQEAEEETVKQYFAKIDTNSDELLSRSEFEGFLQSSQAHFEDDITPTAQEGSIGDIEADNLVEIEELEEGSGQWNAMKDSSENGTEANKEFDRIDIDNDGHLSKAEAARHEVTEAFDDIDWDNDQLVTRIEYSRYRKTVTKDYDE